MALGEEKSGVEASLDTKAPSCGQWSCRGQEVDTPGPVSGEQPPRLEAEGGPASPVWGTEGLPAPVCCPSGACQSQASNTCREPIAGAPQPALSCLLPPASVRTGDLHSVGSQVATKINGTVHLPNDIFWECVPAFCQHFTCFPSPCTRRGIGGSLGMVISVIQVLLENWALGPTGSSVHSIACSLRD